MKKSEKKVNRNRIIGIAVVLILIIVILVAVNITNNNKNVEQGMDCSGLEKIALENFVENSKIENLIQTATSQDKEDTKVQYAINQYLSENSIEDIRVEDILKSYENIFGENKELTLEKIETTLVTRNGIVRNSQTAQYEKQFNNMNGNELSKFKAVTAIKTIEKNKYMVTVDVVEFVNIEALRNYYLNFENAQKANVNMNELVEINENTEDLYKYLNKDNYKEISMEIKSIDVTVKVESNKIMIENF